MSKLYGFMLNNTFHPTTDELTAKVMGTVNGARTIGVYCPQTDTYEPTYIKYISQWLPKRMK